MPEISIVLPVHNGDKYLRESVNSILVQTFTDWELIFVDDASTDESPLIMREYEEHDSRIHVVKNLENQGLPKSLNIGFENACGKYYTWTSDDNLYLPSALQEMYEYLECHDELVMVVANEQFFGGIKEFVLSYDPDTMLFGNSVGACFLYRNEVPQIIGGYDDKWKLIEDYEYWLRILDYYKKIGHIDKVLYRYREHSGSLTGTRRHDIDVIMNRLILTRIDRIVRDYKSNDIEIMRLYYEAIRLGLDDDEVINAMCTAIPELKSDVDELDSSGCIVFGAGRFGHNVKEKLGEKALFYSDSDDTKAYSVKDSIKVISVKEMASKSDCCHIIVAVNYPNALDMIKVLQSNGIYSFISYPRLMKMIGAEW